MKRKIFSKLLMVALVIAAVGSFVSCKDYDDDINNLQKQIDAKAALSELTALQSTLDSKIAAAQSAAAAAQATADAAATKTAVADLKTALESAIADAKKAGTDAGTEAGKAIAAANAAQASADAAAQAAKDADAAAKTALADALKTIEETYQTKAAAAEAAAEAAEALAAVKATADAAFTKAEAEELKAELDGLKESLESSIDEKIAEAIAELGKASASVEAIWSAVTSVDLWAEAKADEDFNLNFYWAEENANVFPKLDGDADAQIEFTDGQVTVQKAIKTIRVSPANATLEPSMIKLINSKGEDLSEFVTVTEVTPNKTLLTRATSASGLWNVTFKLKDNYDAAALNKKVYAGWNGWQYTKNVQFAIAISNTAVVRDVVSSYDVLVNHGEAGHQNNFTVNNVDVDAGPLHNRFAYCEGDNTKSTAKEYSWKRDAKGNILYATEATSDNTVKTGDNVPYLDNRQDGEIIVLDNITDDIKIKFTDKNIRAFYVTLDNDFALESDGTELAGWNAYTYENVGTITTKAHLFEGASGTIKVLEAEKGDIVGFRVYAVHHDGTLYDPDGRSFYVQLGKADPTPSETVTGAAVTVPAKAIAGTTLVTSDPVSFDGYFVANDKIAWSDYNYKFNAYNPAFYTDETGEGTTGVATTGVPFTVKFYKTEANAKAGVSGVDAENLTAAYKFFTFSYDASKLGDDATYSRTLVLSKNTKASGTPVYKEIKKIVFSMKKTLPANTLPSSFGFKENALDADNVITAILTPSVYNTQNSAWYNLKEVIKTPGDDETYWFRFADADKNDVTTNDVTSDDYDPNDIDGKKVSSSKFDNSADNSFENRTNSVTRYGYNRLQIWDNSLIDGKAHAVAIEYAYGKISRPAQKNPADDNLTGYFDAAEDYNAVDASSYKFRYCRWADYASYAWATVDKCGIDGANAIYTAAKAQVKTSLQPVIAFGAEYEGVVYLKDNYFKKADGETPLDNDIEISLENLVNEVVYTNSKLTLANGALLGDLDGLAGYSTDAADIHKVQDIDLTAITVVASDKKSTDTYYKWDSANNKLVPNKPVGTTVLTGDVTEYMKITTKDYFDKDVVIYLPITIKASL